MMQKKISDIFPEIDWISDQDLREKVENTFQLGFEKGGMPCENLIQIPYTVTYPTRISFQEHVRLVTGIAVSMLREWERVKGDESAQSISRDMLIAGALLHDVGKLMELSQDQHGDVKKSENGKLLRHAFTGVHLAMQCAIPDEVVHIIAVHSSEGDASNRSFLAQLVRMADQTAERFSDWELNR